MGLHRLELRRGAGGVRQRSDGFLILLEGIYLRGSRQREGEGANASEQIGDALGPANALFDQPHQDRFRLA
jgi:hypothetical protein